MINDNVTTDFKINHSMRRTNNGDEGFVLLKLDMTKANDRIKWDFLLGMMREMCAFQISGVI